MAIQEDRTQLLQHVQRTLATADRQARRYRFQQGVLLAVSLIFGTLATLLAGDAAVGPPTLSAVPSEAVVGVTPGELAIGWKIVCGAIALCTFLGTVATGLQSLLGVGDHRTRAMLCAGKLQSVMVRLETASHVRREDLDGLRGEVADVITESPEYCR